MALLAGAIERDMPILGVCRGAQVLNVLRGGTLHQHLPDVVASTRHQGHDGVFSSVPVTTVAGTALHAHHPVSRAVPVYHHQAIDILGEGLVAAAWSDDGVVEAIEDPSLTFCIAAQWHPEQDPDSTSLYDAFVDAARAYRR
jgi:putative glutamine amidotransferase